MAGGWPGLRRQRGRVLMAGVTKVTALVRWSAERPNRGPGESWSLERRPASIQATTGEPSRSSSMTSWTPRFGPNGRGSNGPCVTANNGTRPEAGPAAPGRNPRRRVGGSFDQGRPALSLATVDSTDLVSVAWGTPTSTVLTAGVAPGTRAVY